MGDAQARIAEMAQLLRERAPVLCPRVVPAPFKAVASNVLAACVTLQQRADAEDCLQRQKAEAVEQGAPEDARPAIDTEIDLEARTFRICGIKFVPDVEATCCDLQRFLELQLKTDAAEMEPYTSYFVAQNQLQTKGPEGEAVQEVYSLAYALQVASSHMPGWTGFLGPHELPLGEEVLFGDLLEELFRPPPPKKGKGGGKGKGKGKGKAGAKEGGKPKTKSKAKPAAASAAKGKAAAAKGGAAGGGAKGKSAGVKRKKG